jgi:muconate cycloisomerase
LAHLERATGIPVMVDETLVSLADAQALIDAGVRGPWNLRLGKCGGLTGVAALAALAHATGRRVQLGAHVGETTLTANATRAAALFASPLRVDSSFSAWLIAGDPFAAPSAPWPAAVLPQLGEDYGFARAPDPARLARVTIATHRF